MKVLVDLRTLSKNPSGIGYYTYNILKHMEMKDTQVKLFGITDQESGKLLETLKDKMTIIETPFKVKQMNIYRYFLEMEKIITNEKIDILWQPNFIFIKNFKKKHPDLKIVVSIHDASPILHKKNFSILYQLYFRFYVNKAIKDSNHILYISNTAKREVETVFKSASIKESSVIYPLIDYKKMDEKYEKNVNGFLYYGNLEKRKGVHILLYAYDLYRQRGGTKELHLFGNMRNNSIDKQLKEMLEKYDKSIFYHGYLNDSDKWEVISRFGVGIFPSKGEGFGMPAVEMLLSGKSVIVSDIAVYKETIGESGSYFHLVDDIHQSASNLSEVMIQDIYNKRQFDIKYLRFDNKTNIIRYKEVLIKKD